MDIKSEVDIKDELVETSEDISNNGQSLEKDTGLEEIQEKNVCPNKDVKEKMEIEEELLTNEYTESRQPIEQVFVLDEGQIFAVTLSLHIYITTYVFVFLRTRYVTKSLLESCEVLFLLK
ncbi:hypothetical protein Avbf_09112 [Armadillidium vulgare]|nr:hypothetical protein Avbf_09112 [Armadillidium vulgare]